ncbi:PD-(D/E)XK nuclease domain-containing protein [Fibrella aquatilis]|uniref:7-cyano-7-deazaguanine synthase n=1 Tax=Fibrella aquatilis TaxID=2817059 RepID=A0A939JWL7_9BACT|nr:7-cyano-7-deazaguanine synthase [Fibrella aquatilis]MBO0930129.1 7-cyano-7-deazaguanine synthase [Fibrella aquatilis]
MTKTDTRHIILCDGVTIPQSLAGNIPAHRILSLVGREGLSNRNLTVNIQGFASHLMPKLPERTRDLIEIASFIYGADRLIKRGKTDQVEYNSWSRDLIFCIPVRDLSFWQQEEAKTIIVAALSFMTGDLSYDFYFTQRIGGDPITNLFHGPEYSTTEINSTDICPVALFSGGLDSLAGVISLLEQTSQKVVITSHRSNTLTTQVQKRVFEALQIAYPNRLRYHPLECTLKEERAAEETQRTRFFLYTAVGFALAQAYGQDVLNIYENGITSINLSKRQDLMNGRASRTTHPKTLALLENLFTQVFGKNFTIKHPFLHMTKSEVVDVIKTYNKQDIISKTVTCTKTFQKFKNNTSATHCGYCSQCVDRRFAMYATKLEQYDTIYDFDLTTESFQSSDARTHVVDYIRQANTFAKTHFGDFINTYLDPLSEITEFLSKDTCEEDEISDLHNLYQRHSTAVERAYRRMAFLHDSIYRPAIQNSIYTIVNGRRFQLDRVECLANEIADMLSKTLPIAISDQKISHENVLNSHIQAILKRDRKDYEREYPTVRFSFSTVIPDHSYTNADEDLFIESKYIRKTMPPSRVTDQIASDLMKYPLDAFKLFIVYDPERRVKDDQQFKKDYEQRSNCRIFIIR